MGASVSTAARISDDQLVDIALQAGLKVYAGFKATERRLVFVHGDNFKSSPVLHTILPSGDIEGSANGKKLAPTTGKALATFPYPQTLSAEKAKPYTDTHVIWKQKCSTDYALAQIWTINYNDEFREVFEETETNPDPTLFDPQAVEIFYEALVRLFGEEARQYKVKYCTKKTQNIARTFVGTHAQFKQFLNAYGVASVLDIDEVTQTELVVATVDKKGNRGKKVFPYGSNTNEKQVLYKRKGYTSFMCTKSLEQFQTDCKLFGELTL